MKMIVIITAFLLRVSPALMCTWSREVPELLHTHPQSLLRARSQTESLSLTKIQLEVFGPGYGYEYHSCQDAGPSVASLRQSAGSYLYIYLSISVCVCIYICIYIYVYNIKYAFLLCYCLCMYVCVYIYIYIYIWVMSYPPWFLTTLQYTNLHGKESLGIIFPTFPKKRKTD